MCVNQYWGGYIGGTDDSLGLLDYLEDKGKREISLTEVFKDIGLGKLGGDFTQTTALLEYRRANGEHISFDFAINLVIDIAAILLGCDRNGSVALQNLDSSRKTDLRVSILVSAEDLHFFDEALEHFAENPLSYDLGEIVPEEELLEMAQQVEALREDLCGD